VLIALFAGWCMDRDTSASELGMVGSPLFTAWRLLVRFFAPAMVVLVAATKLTA